MKTLTVQVITEHTEALNNWKGREIDVRGKYVKITSGESFSLKDKGDGKIEVTVVSENFKEIIVDQRHNKPQTISAILLLGVKPIVNKGPDWLSRIPIGATIILITCDKGIAIVKKEVDGSVSESDTTKVVMSCDRARKCVMSINAAIAGNVMTPSGNADLFYTTRPVEEVARLMRSKCGNSGSTSSQDQQASDHGRVSSPDDGGGDDTQASDHGRVSSPDDGGGDDTTDDFMGVGVGQSVVLIGFGGAIMAAAALM